MLNPLSSDNLQISACESHVTVRASCQAYFLPCLGSFPRFDGSTDEEGIFTTSRSPASFHLHSFGVLKSFSLGFACPRSFHISSLNLRHVTICLSTHNSLEPLGSKVTSSISDIRESARHLHLADTLRTHVVPVVQGGMQWVGYAELASAVSNAGGLGILTALTQPTPEDLRKEIRKTRTLTKNPFGVNITLLPSINPPDYGAYAQVVIDEGIKIVETAGNSPGPIIKMLKEVGIIILHKCTTIRHAQSAVKLGVDFLSIDGFECAGHVGETDITNFILLSRARQSIKIPFIASGGFADGQGLAAALSLGAEGINMGTRFMCTVEAPIHLKIKEEIVKAQETDTQLVLRRWRNTSRLYKNRITAEVTKIEQESKTGKFEEVAALMSGKRGREVFTTGDPEFGVRFYSLICVTLFVLVIPI